LKESTEPQARTKEPAAYVPALGFRWLTRFYDPLLRLTLREEAFKHRLVDQARVEQGDVAQTPAAGQGRSPTCSKKACREAQSCGLEGDPEASRSRGERWRPQESTSSFARRSRSSFRLPMANSIAWSQASSSITSPRATRRGHLTRPAACPSVRDGCPDVPAYYGVRQDFALPRIAPVGRRPIHLPANYPTRLSPTASVLVSCSR
jgi:hypothetical protein